MSRLLRLTCRRLVSHLRKLRQLRVFSGFLHVTWFRTALGQNHFRALLVLLIERLLSVASLRHACCCPLLPEAAVLDAAHPIEWSLCFVIGVR
jgi:hypothetical protein